jgi:endonuclease/exonuclease/phosphatase family metal-dependent hydrolase
MRPKLPLICANACLSLLSAFANLSAAAEDLDLMCHVNVMTFNIRYNNPGDGDDAWPNRKDMVAEIIRQHADIAGLQEAQLDQIQDLEQRLPGYKWYGVGREDGKQQGEYCPIFYRANRYELLDKQSFWLSQSPEVPGSKSWDTAITRLVTMVRFRDVESDVKFWVLNTHFDHRGAVAREKSAQMLRQRFGKLAGSEPVMVTGDFNCLPDSKPYAVMTADQPGQRLIDARSISERSPAGPDSTWSGFREIAPGRRIDFIFVGPDIKVQQHRTLGDRVNGRFPSDHLPVVAELVFQPK